MNKNRQAIRLLSEKQCQVVILALHSSDYTLKVKNDSGDMGIATMLVRRDIFIRIRKWYSPDGFVIGEIFALKEWVIEIKDGFLAFSVQ